LLMIPSAAILIFQGDQVAGGIQPRIAACVVQEHQGKQACRLRWWTRLK